MTLRSRMLSHVLVACMQTRGAVRDSSKLDQAAFWYKVYAAAAAAAAEQRFEQGLLASALGLLTSSLIDALPAVWAATGEANTRDVAFGAEQMRNATCLCGANVTALLAGTPLFTDAASYYATVNCSGVAQLAEPSWDAQGNVTFTLSPAGAIPAAVCDTAAANLTAHLASYNSTVISLLANQRLGDLRTTGKFAQRWGVAAALRAFLVATYPELVASVFVTPRGADASDVAAATLDTLVALFVEGRQFLLTGAPANLALYRRRLTGVGL